MSKLSDVVKNDVVKKTAYDKLVGKVNNIDTSDFVLKTKYNTNKTVLENKIPEMINVIKKTKLTELENKIPGISNLATKTTLTTAENKVPDVANLATKTALTTAENKIPDVSSLSKKTDYNTKIAKVDIKVSSLDGKINEIKTKNESIGKEFIGPIKDVLLFLVGSITFDGGDGF